MGQLAIGAGFHTFLRRAVFYLFLTHFPYAILMSFMTSADRTTHGIKLGC
jgi:preprotein translocase subunit SecG